MIPVEPFNILAYVDFFKRNTLPNGAKCEYFLSWEDALWELIRAGKIPPRSKALVPSFWCEDVIENMQDHGVRCVTYRVDSSFQCAEDIIIDAISKHTPQVVVIFHAVGIRNRLLTENTKWLAALDSECIFIEDSVHSIISPREVSFVRKNHFIIDSWRKVVPLQGSTIYYKEGDLPSNFRQSRNITLPMLEIMSLWFLMQVALILQKYTPRYFARPLGLFAEKLKLQSYEKIGDTSYSSGTLGVCTYLSQRLAVDRIRDSKTSQVEVYETLIGDLIQNNNRVFPIWKRKTDAGLMKAYPIGLRLPFAEKFIQTLRSSGLLVRSELDESIWGKENNVIFLPLGPQLSVSDIRAVCDIVDQALNTFDATMPA